MRIGRWEFLRVPSPIGGGGGPFAARVMLPLGGSFALGLDQLVACRERWEELRGGWGDVGRVMWATVDGDTLRLRCGDTITLTRDQLRSLIRFVEEGDERDPLGGGCPRCGDRGEWRSLGLVCRQGHGLFG